MAPFLPPILIHFTTAASDCSQTSVHSVKFDIFGLILGQTANVSVPSFLSEGGRRWSFRNVLLFLFLSQTMDKVKKKKQQPDMTTHILQAVYVSSLWLACIIGIRPEVKQNRKVSDYSCKRKSV